MPLAVCFHLHCYQPQRSNPWLDIVEPELSAFPYRGLKPTGHCGVLPAQHGGGGVGTRQALASVVRQFRDCQL